jgi:anaphase-promoting complex subunit 6
VKIDKRFAKAWAVLGHVLAAQEESEHAISAYRAAARLLPGDPRPVIYMGKELMRTNYLSLALHLLTGALKLSPKDPTILNEIGVIYMKQDNLDMAQDHLGAAARIVMHANTGAAADSLQSGECILRENKACSDEVRGRSLLLPSLPLSCIYNVHNMALTMTSL